MILSRKENIFGQGLARRLSQMWEMQQDSCSRTGKIGIIIAPFIFFEHLNNSSSSSFVLTTALGARRQALL